MSELYLYFRSVNRLLPGEEEMIYDSSLSLLENLNNIYSSIQVEDLGSGNFKMKNMVGRELIFTIKTIDGKTFFGWKHEGYLGHYTWNYIAKDIYGYYRTL
jgi:hypothetical protein